jgi:hypothetical protein
MHDTERNKRRFKACAIRETEGTGLGIVEYIDDGQTVGIHSLYYPTKLSNKDTFTETIKHVLAQVDTDDIVILRTSIYIKNKREWARSFGDRLITMSESYKSHAFEEPFMLAGDAIKRKSTICELLEGSA